MVLFPAPFAADQRHCLAGAQDQVEPVQDGLTAIGVGEAHAVEDDLRWRQRRVGDARGSGELPGAAGQLQRVVRPRRAGGHPQSPVGLGEVPGEAHAPRQLRQGPDVGTGEGEGEGHRGAGRREGQDPGREITPDGGHDHAHQRDAAEDGQAEECLPSGGGRQMGPHDAGQPAVHSSGQEVAETEDPHLLGRLTHRLAIGVEGVPLVLGMPEVDVQHTLLDPDPRHRQQARGDEEGRRGPPGVHDAEGHRGPDQADRHLEGDGHHDDAQADVPERLPQPADPVGHLAGRRGGRPRSARPARRRCERRCPG